jgi:hypothetical protein
MSLTSYRAAPPREPGEVRNIGVEREDCKRFFIFIAE